MDDRDLVSDESGQGAVHTLSDLYAKHKNILLKYRIARRKNPRPRKDTESLYGEIALLLREIVEQGSSVKEDDDRRRMQSIADYWSAELWRFEGHEPEKDPWVLRPYRGHKRKNRPDSPETPFRLDSRNTLVRLAAASRLWKQFGEDPGFLILGRKAIQDVEQMKPDDKQIIDFVEASKWHWFKRNTSWSTLAIFLFLVAFSLVYFYTNYIPQEIDRNHRIVLSETASGAQKASALARFGCLISFVPDTTRLFTRVELNSANVSDVSLVGKNFTKSNFCSSKFFNTIISYSVFSESVMRYGVIEKSNFSYSQFQRMIFRNTIIRSSDFSRTVFDKAIFSEVKFQDNNFFQTSFSGATFDNATLESLSLNAWWLASGWSGGVVGRLVSMSPETPLTSGNLKRMESYKRAFIEQICTRPWPPMAAQTSDASDVEFASSYNALAFFYAQWGIEVGAPQLSEAERAKCPAPLNLTAVEAARKAQKAMSPNYDNTLAYVLLQESDLTEDDVQHEALLSESIRLLKSATEQKPTLDETGLLRAVAKYKYLKVVGQGPKVADATMIKNQLSRVKKAVSNPRFTSFDPIYHLTKQLRDQELFAAVMAGLSVPPPGKKANSGQQIEPALQSAIAELTAAECNKATNAERVAIFTKECNIVDVLLEPIRQ